ncbi:MAG: ABC transporter permease [Thermoplasmata archaeon]
MKMPSIDLREVLVRHPRLRRMVFRVRQFRRNTLGVAGLGIILFFLVLALLAPVLTTPNQPDPYRVPKTWILEPQPPDSQFLLGTGPEGVDIYYGVIWGSRISFTIAVTVVFLSAVIGIAVGLFAGYLGGKVDELLMRLSDLFLALPAIVLVMAIIAVLGRSIENLTLALVIVWWPRYARLVRGEALVIKEQHYVLAARSISAPHLWIIRKHIIPNAVFASVVLVTMDMGLVVLIAAGLSFIGLGAESGTAEWGLMTTLGKDWIVGGKWWVSFFPGTAIFLFVLGWNLLGDAFRDLFDPKMKIPART